jgi:hypothetical protein
MSPAPVGRAYEEAKGEAPAEPERSARVSPDTWGRGFVAHAKIQNEIARTISKLGWIPLAPKAKDPPFDLAWEANGALYVCEVKSLTEANEETQMRAALAQVIRYRQRLVAAGHEPAFAVVVAEREPKDPTWSTLFEDDLGIILIWPAVAEERLCEAVAARAVSAPQHS